MVFQRKSIAQFCVLLIILFSSQASVAQSVVHRMYFFSPGIIASAGVGPSIAFTDIKQNVVFQAIKPQNEWRLASQFSLKWEIIPLFSIRTQISLTYIAGTRPTAERHFEAKLLEGNIGLVFNPVMLFTPYRSDYKWTPSIIAGIGLSYYNSQSWTLSTNELIAVRGYGSGGGLWAM